MQLRRTALVGTVAVAVGLLSGCTGTGHAAVPPLQAAPTPSAAPSTTVVASSAPLVAKVRPAVRRVTGGLGAHLLTGVADVAAPAAAPIVRKGRLAGLTIVLDPGHNGGNSAQPQRLNALVPAGGFRKPCNTSGAETNGGYPEHAFTFDVVTRAAALLRAAGAKVVLTRHSDTGFGPCVNQRAAIGNAAHADAVVAVHADGASSGAYGFHVIAPALAPDGGNRAILARSWTLAQDMHQAFHAVAGEPFSTYISGGLTRRTDLAGLNLSRVPAIFIECANMRNAADARRLTSPAWRQKAAAGIVAGVTAFLQR